MRITHLISGLLVGGAETMLCRLLAVMDRERFQSEVICLREPGPMADRIRAVGVPVLALGMRRGRPSVSGFCRLTAELRRSRPDVLQTWLYHADIAGLLAGKVTRVPSIVWNVRTSDMDMSQYSAVSSLTVRACARSSHRPAAVIVNSHAGQRHHERIGYRPRRWVMIPNGVDTTLFSPDPQAGLNVRAELGLSPEALVIGSIARFDPMKDQVGFLRAAATVARIDRRIQFVLAGPNVDWDNAVLREAAADSHLQGRVHLIGCRRDVPQLMAALDLAVSSSTCEGFPNVLAEAMSSGIACVATDVGDSAFIVGRTGEVVEPNDRAALAAAMTRMIQLEPSHRAELGMQARERIVKKFDFPTTVASYERFYESLPVEHSQTP